MCMSSQHIVIELTDTDSKISISSDIKYLLYLKFSIRNEGIKSNFTKISIIVIILIKYEACLAQRIYMH